MFEPPRCPSSACEAHTDPLKFAPRFYYHNGEYHPKCRAQPVPRFKCRVCGLGFSRQTFRMDYCDNKPHLNAWVFKLLASGAGLRQAARVLCMSRRCLELKARKISKHLGRLNRNLIDQFDPECEFSLDEMETFEGERRVSPVSVPILIESRTYFVVATDVATIKPSGRIPKDRRQAIERAERRYGAREDRSANALHRVFRRLKAYGRDLEVLKLTSDKKHLYARLATKYFGEKLIHTRISSRRKRDQLNPLRHINVTNAMARDLVGRLHRRSWLVSKMRRYLRLHLHIFVAFRNFIRRRINREHRSAAQALGFVHRPADYGELLSWRQDWKERSVHPLSRRTASIEEVRRRAA